MTHNRSIHSVLLSSPVAQFTQKNAAVHINMTQIRTLRVYSTEELKVKTFPSSLYHHMANV